MKQPDNFNVTVPLESWQRILDEMDAANSLDGFIGHDEAGEMVFYLQEPEIGAAAVTRKTIVDFIRKY